MMICVTELRQQYVTGSPAGQSEALPRYMGGIGHGPFLSFEIAAYLA